jgi:hypothetical protein
MGSGEVLHRAHTPTAERHEQATLEVGGVSERWQHHLRVKDTWCCALVACTCPGGQGGKMPSRAGHMAAVRAPCGALQEAMRCEGSLGGHVAVSS